MVVEKETSYVDAQEAARMLGVNKRAVRNLVARRRLESKRDGGGAAARLLVSVASLEKLRSDLPEQTGAGTRNLISGQSETKVGETKRSNESWEVG